MTAPISRQRAWQKRQHAAGRCIKCGQPRTGYAVYCDRHAAYDRARLRRRKVAR
jgi:hypothetical protein